MNEQIDRHLDSREPPLRLSDSGRHPAAVAHRRDMRVEMDLLAEHMGMELGAWDFRREGVAHLRGRIVGHRPGRRGVSLFCHDIGNEKTECLMRKQEYEVVKHRGVYGWDSILQSPESTINSTSRQNMPTITAHIANNRFPVFLPEYLAKILSLTWNGRKGKAQPAGQGQWPDRISNRLQSGGTGSTISWPHRDTSTT